MPRSRCSERSPLTKKRMETVDGDVGCRQKAQAWQHNSPGRFRAAEVDPAGSQVPPLEPGRAG